MDAEQILNRIEAALYATPGPPLRVVIGSAGPGTMVIAFGDDGSRVWVVAVYPEVVSSIPLGGGA